MSELSQEARGLIESAGRADDPTAEDRARIKNRLATELGAAAFATAAAVNVGTTASAAATGASSVGQSASAAAAAAGGVKAGMLGGLGKVLIGASLVGALGTTGVLTLSSPAKRGPQSAQTETRAPAPVVQAPAPAITPEPVVTPDPVAEASAPEVPAAEPMQPPLPTAKKPARTMSAAKPQPAPHDLGAELALLNGAQWALRQGQPAQALSMAREHASRFPAGDLREERAGIEALARCALGHEGARVLEDLERIAPASPLLARVRSACGLE